MDTSSEVSLANILAEGVAVQGKCLHHVNLVIEWFVYTDLLIAQGSDFVGHHCIGKIYYTVCSGRTGTRANQGCETVMVRVAFDKRPFLRRAEC